MKKLQCKKCRNFIDKDDMEAKIEDASHEGREETGTDHFSGLWKHKECGGEIDEVEVSE